MVAQTQSFITSIWGFTFPCGHIQIYSKTVKVKLSVWFAQPNWLRDKKVIDIKIIKCMFQYLQNSSAENSCLNMSSSLALVIWRLYLRLRPTVPYKTQHQLYISFFIKEDAFKFDNQHVMNRLTNFWIIWYTYEINFREPRGINIYLLILVLLIKFLLFNIMLIITWPWTWSNGLKLQYTFGLWATFVPNITLLKHRIVQLHELDRGSLGRSTWVLVQVLTVVPVSQRLMAMNHHRSLDDRKVRPPTHLTLVTPFSVTSLHPDHV